MKRDRRRRFLFAAATLLAAPFARAQRLERPYRIGYPAVAPFHTFEHFMSAFEEGLRAHGHMPGRDVVIERRSAEGNLERYPEVVREVVSSNPDVIITGVNANTTAVKALTDTIPIVMMVGTDVINQGYVKSFAKPGGNITGLTWDVGGGTVSKRLELLKEAAPAISRVAVLFDPPYEVEYGAAIRSAAAALGVELAWFDATDDFSRSFAAATGQAADALFINGGARMFARRAEVVALAAKYRLPAAYFEAVFVDAGGLMSYGPNIPALFRAGARFVDKILKGARPGDLPIEQPTKIDFIINLRTARSLGLSLPQSLLLRADRVIE
jgi:putative ABC transport system substrate-binding protein